tara:strand:- start:212818 stop:213726 length:909 start_codon:yes stop_codon:yes gene_type:complete
VQAIQKTGLKDRERCDLCGGARFQFLFSKSSEGGQEFGIYRCQDCSLVQTLPRPDDEELKKCYGEQYFSRRTERGYDNYMSAAMRKQLQKVWLMNLKDVEFLDFEDQRFRQEERRALDVGCAGGFFVEFLESRGWQAEGIELSESVAAAGIREMGLRIHIQDFLQFQPESPYDLITLWASIEHLRSPSEAMKKISSMLKPGGMLILSTCRWGALSKVQGPSWRFLNVPEHLFYFSTNTMEKLARRHGLQAQKRITYGSGFTAFEGMGVGYRLMKSVADRTVKLLGQGDMMVYSFKKTNVHSL